MRAWSWIALLAPVLWTLPACKDANFTPDPKRDDSYLFPQADRPVSSIGSNQFSTERQRDSAGEAQEIMDRAGIAPGMSVADLGAGNGYYTVRLAERVGPRGRVLAQDIDPAAIRALGERVARENLDNVSIITGKASDPRLPKASFDRIFMVHMYHEVADPYAFLWHMRPALKPGGQIIVVETDKPTDRHGIPPRLLSCELGALGLEMTEFVARPELGSYFARFIASAPRPAPDKIHPCDQG